MSAISRVEGGYSETEIDDETVVMNLNSGEFFSLTDTARAIWKLIDGRRDRAAVVAALAATFGVKPEEVAADLDPFLQSLAAAGLIAER
jgi:pyrroloquinoline quinone biosynthesis protein D